MNFENNKLELFESCVLFRFQAMSYLSVSYFIYDWYLEINLQEWKANLLQVVDSCV